MRKIKDIIRLRQQAGLSQRKIANALRLYVGVVNKYLTAAAAAELTWPLPDLCDTELRQHFQPGDESLNPAQPDLALIHQELKKKGVTRQLLWEEYVAVHPTHHYKYNQFCHHYRQWCKRQKSSMRQTHHAGKKMFVDQVGPTVQLINPKTKETSTAQIFVAVLDVSN
jgi:transposase